MSDRTALLVIDVQEGCFEFPGLHIPRVPEFLSRVSDLLSKARSTGTPVVYLRHLGASGSTLDPGGDGVRIHAAVSPEPGDVVVEKRESDGFLRTELHAKLQALGVADLVVCGMQSEYCVDTTCRSAYAHGYGVTLVRDAHTTGDAGSLTAEQIIEHHNETLDGAFATLCSTAEAFSQ